MDSATGRPTWLLIPMIFACLSFAFLSDVANASGQVPVGSTLELDQHYNQFMDMYARRLKSIRKSLIRSDPGALSTYDSNNLRWTEYVAGECDDMLGKLYHGGTVVPNLGLRCKIDLYRQRLKILERDFAAIQH